MSADLDACLIAALRGAVPSSDATGRARDVVLAACPPPARRRRWRATGAGLLLAAAVGAGVGMAATGSLPTLRDEPQPPTIGVPAGRLGATALWGGRAWVATPEGGVISREATAVEMSPAGHFVAFGGRGVLVAAEVDGTQRWTHRVRGTVVRIAWAPYPTYIAYVVRRGWAHDLHVIWANGRNDVLAAAGVRPDGLRWRPDTSGVTYVDAGGAARVWYHP
jgi:hypothetical protein